MKSKAKKDVDTVQKVEESQDVIEEQGKQEFVQEKDVKIEVSDATSNEKQAEVQMKELPVNGNNQKIGSPKQVASSISPRFSPQIISSRSNNRMQHSIINDNLLSES